MNTRISEKRPWTFYALATLFSAFLLFSVQPMFGRMELGRIAGITVYLDMMFVLILLTAPIITMRLIAEERKLGTLETLLTSPVSEPTRSGSRPSRFMARSWARSRALSGMRHRARRSGGIHLCAQEFVHAPLVVGRFRATTRVWSSSSSADPTNRDTSPSRISHISSTLRL